MFLEVAILVGLIFLNGFFAMSELAIVSARPARLRAMAEEGHKGAVAALELVEEPTRFLSTVQVGITLIGIVAGAYSGATFAEPLAALIEPAPVIGGAGAYALSFAAVVAATTYLSLIVGELVPKRIALNNAERIAGFVAPSMAFLATLGAPAIWFLKISTEAVIRALGVKPGADGAVTEDDVRAMIAEGAAAGVFDRTETDMLEQVFRLGDRPVRSLMTPRPDVAWLPQAAPFEEMLGIALESGHSRFPVCGDSVDEVIGVVHVKELLRVTREQQQGGAPAIEEPLYVIESMPGMRLLDRMRQTSVHMAIVVDEYGSFEGIVTPMDILKAIAGELPEHEDDLEPLAVRRDDGSWLLDGGLPIGEAERLLDPLPVPEDANYSTIAGFLLHRLGHIPAPGEVVETREWRFEIVDLDNRRIDKVIAARRADMKESDAAELI